MSHLPRNCRPTVDCGAKISIILTLAEYLSRNITAEFSQQPSELPIVVVHFPRSSDDLKYNPNLKTCREQTFPVNLLDSGQLKMSQDPDEQHFWGPLFIVGMARSGTKLLRSILNGHPRIGIPRAEVHVIPLLLDRLGSEPFPLRRDAAARFKKLVLESEFHNRMSQLYGCNPSGHEFDQLLSHDSLQACIEATIRYYTEGEHNFAENYIWGDKTPNNLIHLARLKLFFPQARFIHIIRDPRDRALSAREAWGANLYLSCQRWRDRITIAREQSRDFQADYHEVLYERLTSNPEAEITAVCNFIGVEFDPAMLTLDAPIETLGDPNNQTRTSHNIVTDNVGKFAIALNPRQLRRMNEIAQPIASECGYLSSGVNIGYRGLDGLERVICTFADQVAALWSNLRRWGLITGLRRVRSRLRSNRA